MVFPFLTLQALGLGLTYADISIVYGLSPVLCLGAQPLAGREINTSSTKVHTKQISGFIGDKIGFRVVLMIYVLLNLLLETSLTLIPVYQELQQIPHVLLYKNNSATTESQEMKYSLLSAQWAICQDSFTSGNCLSKKIKENK